ncbi:MAG: hypothetical protein K6E19_11065 [Lachnospiraceae bacterium]|nr:hypothetical protein [Lachnospiraceae bacterium]
MKINYNVSAMIANSALRKNDEATATSLERLSSGLKINHAKDNASGLAMAKRMNAQIKSLEVANQNSNDGVSVIEIAEGALQEVEDMIQRMNELAVKACNGTMSDNDRKNINEEIKQLKAEVERVAKTTMYNGRTLLDGSFDVKGYSDNIDLKVTTYSDDVRSGKYSIQSIETAYFADGRLDPEGCKIKLGPEFPKGCVPTFDGDRVIVNGPDGFSMEFRLMPDDFKKYEDEIKDKTLEGMRIKSLNETEGQIKFSGINLEKYYPGAAEPAEFDDNVKRYILLYEDDPVNNKDDDLEEYLERDGSGNVIAYKHLVKDSNGQLLGYYTLNEEEDTLKMYGAGGTLKGEYVIDGNKIKQKQPSEETYYIDTNVAGKPVRDENGEITTHVFLDPRHQFAAEEIKLDITGLGSMKVQTGSNEGQELDVRIKAISTRTLGLQDKDVLTEDNANVFLAQMDYSIKYINSARSALGAYQNRLEHTISTLDISEENMTGAYSRIMDIDMAEEMTEYTKNNVLVQAGTSMLAQANERPSSVLQLLQG